LLVPAGDPHPAEQAGDAVITEIVSLAIDGSVQDGLAPDIIDVEIEDDVAWPCLPGAPRDHATPDGS
jgi:hypothetical protein